MSAGSEAFEVVSDELDLAVLRAVVDENPSWLVTCGREVIRITMARRRPNGTVWFEGVPVAVEGFAPRHDEFDAGKVVTPALRPEVEERIRAVRARAEAVCGKAREAMACAWCGRSANEAKLTWTCDGEEHWHYEWVCEGGCPVDAEGLLIERVRP
jgi:hypothetical protein